MADSAAAPVAYVTVKLPDFWVKNLRIRCLSRSFSAARRPPLVTTLAANDHKTVAEMGKVIPRFCGTLVTPPLSLHV
jgi:hypothetical protein